MAEVAIAVVGDLMLGRKVAPLLERYGPEYVWGDVIEEFRRADFAVGNLECALTERTEEAWPERRFHFGAPPKPATAALTAAGFAYVSLANNHALDFGVAGAADTRAALDAAGILNAGCGEDLESAAAPVVIERSGIRMGLLSAADHPEEWRAGDGKPGTFRISVPPKSHDWQRIASAVKDLRGRVDLVVMSLHWGPNMRTRPTPAFRDFAARLVAAGVDLVHGHSAHVFQPLEVRDGAVVLYDCGDFVDDYAVDDRLRNDFAILHRVIVDTEAGGIQHVELVPCRIDAWHGRVNHATGAERDTILGRAADGLAEFRTRFERRPQSLVVPVATRAG